MRSRTTVTTTVTLVVIVVVTAIACWAIGDPHAAALGIGVVR